MIGQKLIVIAALVANIFSSAPDKMSVKVGHVDLLAEKSLDLNTRARGEQVNEVFSYNILLAVEKFDYGFTLEPGEVFAFHEQIRPEFKKEPLKTGFTGYEASEGYKTILGLPGNGVCHLASLMNWTASDAGLEILALVNHNFAPVPEVPAEYGTSIYYMPDGSRNSANQNLYIKNTFDYPVQFVFSTHDRELNLRIITIRDRFE